MPTSTARHLRFLFSLLISLAVTACSKGSEVDPGLVGAWQLQYAGAPIYWKIHANGTYEITGAGAGAGHSGNFTAENGRWSLHSPTWGDDGGTYEASGDRFIGTGKLGPGTWLRVGATAAPTTQTVSMTTQLEESREIPVDVPRLLGVTVARARTWQKDAIPVFLEYEYVDAPNPKARGPQVQVHFVSPATSTGLRVTLREGEMRTFEVNQKVDWGTLSLPPAFADLPTALRKARADGMSGPLSRASIRYYSPGKAPSILAWMINPTRGEGRTLDGSTGEVLRFDVTGYIAAYNAQWEEASRRLQALFRKSQHAVGGRTGGDFWPEPSVPDSGSVPQSDSSSGETRQEAAARRASGVSHDDYNRILNGECTMQMNSDYGC